ncbi:Sec-independent protein translocase protein TatB [Sulfuricurvum sp.]|uniref:Sec-independent protein translocase protein TatB n=1 Tax=Sulfuricurvum sp. TaxID=2025608 RepID=UPI002617B116|nr:Sec-independent protein translocase protein TatB [Sulfuricurvum sp.]MDD4950255.1 Sec-independent protein translocase protein TatB [Sulfuricurvum sp.]
MFGLDLGEILVIAIIAVLFLGPEKLPETMVQIAKFFKSVKSTVNTAKATIAEEMKLSEIKEDVLNYKNELTSASSELERMTNVTEIGSELTGIKSELDFSIIAPSAPKEPEVVTFAPKPKEVKAVETKPSEENV